MTAIRRAPDAELDGHDSPLQMNVARHTTHELEAAQHWWAIPERERTIVQLDIAHCGLGKARLGPDTAQEHRLTDLNCR